VKREPALAEYLAIATDPREAAISDAGVGNEATTTPMAPAMTSVPANETTLSPDAPDETRFPQEETSGRAQATTRHDEVAPRPAVRLHVVASPRPRPSSAVPGARGSGRPCSRPAKRHLRHREGPKKLGRHELGWSPSCKGIGAMSYARVEGCKMHWAELGQGPPLVLLHGLCDSHRTWLKVAPILARTRRVFLLDLAGHGLSERPDASYALAWHARVVGAWLGALGLEDVDLVGHSYGGGVALWMMLLEHRARIRKLALVAAGGLGRDVCVPLRLASIPVVVERFGQAFMGRGTRMALNSMGGAFDAEESARLSAMNATAGTARAFARSVRDVIDWRGQHRHVLDGAGELGPLPPVALFWGDRDPVIPIAHATASASLLGGAPITRFPGCGHFPHRERPAEFAAALEAFLGAPSEAGEVRSAA
jgi:pimeloyl-ACP methyl ester carboxylesterase